MVGTMEGGATCDWEKGVGAPCDGGRGATSNTCVTARK